MQSNTIIWVLQAIFVAMGAYAVAGGVSWWHFAESGACAPGQIAQYRALAFYDDLAQTPDALRNRIDDTPVRRTCSQQCSRVKAR